MKIPFRYHHFTVMLFCLCFFSVSAQEEKQLKISIDHLFDLVVQNNPTLRTSKTAVSVAKSEIAIAKNSQLPDFKISANAMYIGDGTLLDKGFSEIKHIDIPSFGNNYNLEATQLIFNGATVKNAVKVKTLQEQISQLSYDATEQNIKLIVLSYYLDIFKLQNQINVYLKNIDLAKQRINNINRFFEQGMVTKNDVIRAELQLSNLTLALQVIQNNKQIINNQLTTAIGQDKNLEIVADDTILKQALLVDQIQHYLDLVDTHPSVQIAESGIKISQIAQRISKGQYFPTLAAFASSSLNRPITSSSPALDAYANNWNVGLSLSYTISSLYKNAKHVAMNNYQIQSVQQQKTEITQQIDLAVRASYIKYLEAKTQNETLEQNKNLAEENYRIMESKYNNHLAILLDMLDASNMKLDAELQLTNSEINIVYNYYKLLKDTGRL